MMNSRSKASRNKLLSALVMLCAVLGMASVAEAGRKRVVVLDFEGPKSEKFHDDLVKLIKKSHTVVSTDKWNGTAEEQGATGMSEKSLKKVAKRLKVDAVIEGRIEKRRDAYILHLKLHAGKTGRMVGDTFNTKADGPRIDGRAARDIKDELLEALDGVETNRNFEVASEDGEDARPARRGGKKIEEEEEEADRPAKKARRTEDEEEEEQAERPAKKGFGKRNDDERGGAKVARRADEEEAEDKPAKKPAKKIIEEEEEDRPAKKPTEPAESAELAEADDEDKLPPRRRASEDEDEDEDEDDERKSRRKKLAAADDESGGEVEAEAERGPAMDPQLALSPGHRALDVVAGGSWTIRRLSFKQRSGFMAEPAGYNGNVPAGGAMIDATLYPLAIGHTRGGVLKDLGLTVMYDRVLFISSKDPDGNKLDTKESRYALGAVFRYPLGRSADAMVLGGSLSYGRQFFRISGQTDTTVASDSFVPAVSYTMIEPGVMLRYPISPKLGLGVDVKALLITDAGQIQLPEHYGQTTLFGVEGAVNLDYLITRNIFARAAVRFETIGMTFKGNGARSNSRDGDMTTVDITGARDSYLGAVVTAGYAY